MEIKIAKNPIMENLTENTKIISITLNLVSGRLQIPKSREELTVAAVGGNL